MMFCRTAWHRLAPLTRTTLTPLARNAVPTRQMSFGLPASGTNIAFVVLGGSSLTAALVYAYKTINSDSARYNERIAEIEARAKSEGGVGTTVAEAAPVAEVAAVVESAAAVLEEVAAEPTLAAANEAESVIAAAVEVDLAAEAASVTAEAAAPAADEPTTPVMEDAAPASVAETTAHPISDLLSTVKIIAGGAVEIAAASVGDQHLVASVRLAEKNAGETLNGLEVADGKEEVPAKVSDTKEAVDGEAMVRRFDTEEVELEELNKAPETEDVTVSAVDYVELYGDNPVAVLFEDPASLQETSETLASTEMEDVSGLAEPASPVMTSEDDVMSAVGDVTLDTVQAAVLDEEIEEVKAYHESAETEAIDITAPQALQTSTTAEDISFSEATLNALDETKSSEYSEEGNDS